MPASIATSSTGGASGTSTPATSFASNAGGRAQMKMTSKMDTTRKQAGSPVDGASKKPPQKAWTTGTNPITQRASTPTTSNGVTAPSKTPAAPKTTSPLARESNTPEKHANDRLLFLMASSVGLYAVITTKNGERFSGIFSTPSLEPSELRYVMKMTKKVLPDNGAAENGVSEAELDYIGIGEDYVKTFDVADVVDLSVPNISLTSTKSKVTNGAGSSFKTDTEISSSFAARERQLQRWEPEPDSNMNLSLEDSGRGVWDQFAANQQLFGLNTNYDENMYTTAIDRSHPEYRRRAEKAERIAREIESGTAMNAHVAEERGRPVVDDSGMDEEDKYSGVRRGGEFPPLPSGQPNKYTPPAKRNQAPQTTVPAPPADPAIVSVQAPSTISTSPSVPTTTEATPAPSAPAPVPTKAEEPKLSAPTPKANEESVNPTAEPKPAVSPVPSSSNPASEQKANTPANAPAAAKPPTVIRTGENDVLSIDGNLIADFKQFKANEKAKMIDRHRQQSKANREVKLNDLKKFAQNFKLNTPVPQDLVPILAKDKEKQDEIVTKAKKQAEESKTTPSKPAPSVAPSSEQKVTRPVPSHGSPSGPLDRQNVQRGRSGQGTFTQAGRGDRPVPPQNIPVIPPHRSGPLPLGARLQLNHQAHRQNMAQGPMNPPFDLRIPPPGTPGSSGLTSPTSASMRFNAAAMEFKPNVGAKSFQPNGSSGTPSPRRESVPRIEPKKTLVSFWGDRKPTPRADRPDFKDAFNPIKRMKKEVTEEQAHKYASNQGIPPAFQTKPTWDCPKENEDKSHVEMFGKPQLPGQAVSPPHNQVNNGAMPTHQHQLPHHLHNGPSSMAGTPHQTPRHMHSQPHHPYGGHHHFNDQPVHFNPSHSVQPSPRPMPAAAAYAVQYAGQAPPVQIYQQGIQGYGMPANLTPMAFRQVSGGAPQFSGPNGQLVGAPMMGHSPSSGPYVQPMTPQMQMYAQPQGHVFPQGVPYPQAGPNAFGSPGPRFQAPMMSHQGSQQGPPPQPVMYVQHGNSPAMFAAQPGPMTPMRQPYAQPNFGPNQHYPQQHYRNTPQATHAHPIIHHPNMAPQGPPNGPQGPQHIPVDGPASEEVK